MKLSDLNIFNLISRAYFQNRDRAYEESYGIRTSEKSQIIFREGLNTKSEYIGNATAYQGIWFDIIEKLVRAAERNGINLSDYTFVDVGSGMGKACICASEFEFKKIRGFDFDKSLVEIAKQNLELVRKKKKVEIEFFEADAAEIKLPLEPTFLFFYHPFDHIVMRQFLKNNIDLFEKHVVIGYSNDQYRFLFEDMGLKKLYRHDKRRTSLWSNF